MNQYSYIDFKFEQGNGQLWVLLTARVVTVQTVSFPHSP